MLYVEKFSLAMCLLPWTDPKVKANSINKITQAYLKQLHNPNWGSSVAQKVEKSFAINLHKKLYNEALSVIAFTLQQHFDVHRAEEMFYRFADENDQQYVARAIVPLVQTIWRYHDLPTARYKITNVAKLTLDALSKLPSEPSSKPSINLDSIKQYVSTLKLLSQMLASLSYEQRTYSDMPFKHACQAAASALDEATLPSPVAL